VDLILAIPLVVRLVVLLAAGAIAGAAVNRAIARPARNATQSARRKITPSRWVLERLPVVGWLVRARTSPGSWLRPLAVELIAALAFAALYLWETQDAPLFVPGQGAAAPAANFLTDNLPLVAHARYVSHVVLLVLMLAASLLRWSWRSHIRGRCCLPRGL
jgi:hypothetical protein